MGVRLIVVSIEGRDVSEEIAYPFDQQRVVIGRGAAADVRIPHATISEIHAHLDLGPDGYGIIDNGSTNGTRINGQALVTGRRRALKEGDQITLGVYVLALQTGRLVTEPITAERTSELARRLLRESRTDPGGISPPRLVVLDGEDAGARLEIPPSGEALTVGRDESCALRITDDEVSRRHLEVRRDLDGVEVFDLTSKNGLAVNGQPVERRRLRDGDEVKIGRCRLLFEDPAEESIRALQAEPDIPLETAQEQSDPGPEAPSAAAQTSPGTESAPPAPAREPGLDADLIIYALAAMVMLFSIAGLFWLLRSG